MKKNILKKILRPLQAILIVGCSISGIMLVISVFQNPFASIWVERESEEIKQKIEKIIASEIDHSWINSRLDDALNVTQRDWDQIDFIIKTAQEEQIKIEPALKAKEEEIRKSDTRFSKQSLDCLECAYDVDHCPNNQMLISCNLPLQLTPIGDIQTLVVNYEKSRNGEPIDELDTKLAILGLLATGAIVVSGGTSATVKGALSTLRVTLKSGILTKGDYILDLPNGI